MSIEKLSFWMNQWQNHTKVWDKLSVVFSVVIPDRPLTYFFNKEIPMFHTAYSQTFWLFSKMIKFFSAHTFIYLFTYITNTCTNQFANQVYLGIRDFCIFYALIWYYVWNNWTFKFPVILYYVSTISSLLYSGFIDLCLMFTVLSPPNSWLITL